MKNRAMLGPVTAHPDRPAAARYPGRPDPAPRRVPGLRLAAGGQATALLAVVASLAGAQAALRAGADLVDLGAASPDVIRAVQARLAGVAVCAAGPPADVVRDVGAARQAGAVALCDGIDAARGSGLPASRVLVEVPPWLVPLASAESWATIVDADRGAVLAERRAAAEWPGAEWPGTEWPGADWPGADWSGTEWSGAEWPAPGWRTAGDVTDDSDSSGVQAIAAVSSWLGATVVRTRHAAAVRRALDMTASIRGLRPPARAVRGLA